MNSLLYIFKNEASFFVAYANEIISVSVAHTSSISESTFRINTFARFISFWNKIDWFESFANEMNSVGISTMKSI